MIDQLISWGRDAKGIADDAGITTRALDYLRSGERKGTNMVTYMKILPVWQKERRKQRRVGGEQ